MFQKIQLLKSIFYKELLQLSVFRIWASEAEEKSSASSMHGCNAHLNNTINVTLYYNFVIWLDMRTQFVAINSHTGTAVTTLPISILIYSK